MFFPMQSHWPLPNEYVQIRKKLIDEAGHDFHSMEAFNKVKDDSN